MQQISRIIPILGWLPHYNRELGRGDLIAGITVAVMLIPQGMAYAVLAGVPPVYGLYASIVPLILYAMFGTSRQLAVGPVAMVSILVFAGLSEVAQPGSAQFIELAILTTLGVGIVQFAMGITRMGFLVNFLSHPVLSGFTSAAAVIIAVSQLRHLLGLPPLSGSANPLLTLYEIAGQITASNPFTALLGIGSIAVIIGIRRWKKSFPSALLVVAVGTVIVGALNWETQGVAIVGVVPTGLPSPGLPSVTFEHVSAIMPLVLVISLVGYMESMAIAKSTATRRGYKIDPNQELVGLGVANLGGALFQSIPTTGGLSRTAVNDQSGANTPLAAVFTASLILVTVLFLTPLFHYLPMAILAAVIMVAVTSLFDMKTMRTLWKTDRKDFAMLMVTFLATLIFGIKEGIAIGIIISLGMVVYNSTRPHFAELGQLGQSKNFRNLHRYKEARSHKGMVIFRYDAPLYFTNSSHFVEKTTGSVAVRTERIEHFLLDASSINYIDSTGIHALEELLSYLDQRGIRFSIAGAIGPVRDKLKSNGLMHRISVDHFFFDVAEAVERLNGSTGSATGSASEHISPAQTNN